MYIVRYTFADGSNFTEDCSCLGTAIANAREYPPQGAVRSEVIWPDGVVRWAVFLMFPIIQN